MGRLSDYYEEQVLSGKMAPKPTSLQEAVAVIGTPAKADPPVAPSSSLQLAMDNASFVRDELFVPDKYAMQFRMNTLNQLGYKATTDEDIEKARKDIYAEKWKVSLEQAPPKTVLDRIWDSIYDWANPVNPFTGKTQRGKGLRGILFGTETTGAASDDEGMSRKGFGEAMAHGRRRITLAKEQEAAGALKMIADVTGNEKLNRWSDMLMDDIEQAYDEDPGIGISLKPGTGILGTIVQAYNRPEILVQSTVEMLPMVVGAMAGGAAAKAIGGGARLAWAGRVAGISQPLVGQNYAEARRSGVKPEDAFPMAVLQAYGEGVLEEWTLSAKVNIFKNAFAQEAKRGIAMQALAIAAEGGRSFGRGYAEEYSQGVNSRFWQMIFADQETIQNAIIDSLGDSTVHEEATLGAIQEMVLGTGSKLSGNLMARATSAVSRKAKLSRLKSLENTIRSDESISDKEKTEILDVIEAKRGQVEAGKDDIQTYVFDTQEEAAEAAGELQEMAIDQNKDVIVTQKGRSVVVEDLSEQPIEEEKGPAKKEQAPKEMELAANNEPLPEFTIEIKDEKDVTDADRRTLRKHRATEAERAKAEVEADPYYEQAAEAAAAKEDLVEPQKVWFPKNLRGEVKNVVEGNPVLQTFVTNKKGTAKTFDEIQEDIRRKTGRDVGVGELLEMLSEAVDRRKKIGGVPVHILNEMDASGDPFAIIAAMKHTMLNKGYTIDQINDEIDVIAKEFDGLDPHEYDLYVRPATTKDGIVIPDVEKSLVARKNAPGLTKAEQRIINTKVAQKKMQVAQMKGEDVGYKMGRLAGILEGKAREKDVLRKARETFSKKLAAEKEAKRIAKAKAKEKYDARLQKDRERAREQIARIRGIASLSKSNRKIVKELIRGFVPDANGQRQFFGRLAGIDNVTDIQRGKFFDQVRDYIELAERKALVDKAKEVFKAIKPGDMAPEYRKAVESIKRMFTEVSPTEETIDAKAELLDYAEQALQAVFDMAGIDLGGIPLNEMTIEQLESHYDDIDSVIGVEAYDMVRKLREWQGKKPIAELTNEELTELITVIETIDAMNKQDDAILSEENASRISERQGEIESELKSRSKETGVYKRIKDFIAVDHANLESLGDNMSGGIAGRYSQWVKMKHAITRYVYDMIDRAVDRQYQQSEATQEMIRFLIDKYKVDPLALESEKRKFTLKDYHGNDVEAELSVSEVLSIYMHTRNPHNLKALLNEGMDRVDKNGTTRYRGFTRETVDAIVNSLTPEQKEFARAVGSLIMDGANAVALNQTSILMENREIASIKNYWPAARHVLSDAAGKKPVGVQSLLEGLGLLKSRTGTINPLRLRGFLQTVYETNKNVAAYYGLAPALRDVKATALTADMQIKFEEAGWGSEHRAIMDLVARIEDNSQEVASRSEGKVLRTMAWVRSQFAKSAFGLHPKLWMRQQISELLLAAYVDGKYLTALRYAPTQELIDRIEALSIQTKFRFRSHRYDRDVGDAVMDNEFMDYLTGDGTFEMFKRNYAHKNYRGILNNAQAVGLWGMKHYDRNAMVEVFRVAEAEIQGERKDLALGSDEYNQALKERFEWLVRHTQPMWHTKDRSSWGSTKDEGIRYLTMFMSQREQLMRMLTGAVVRLKNSEGTMADKKEFGKVVGAVLLNTILISGFNSAFALAISGDDDKWVSDLIFDAIQNTLGLPYFSRLLTEAARAARSIYKHQWVEVDIDEGPLSLAEPLVEGHVLFWKAAFEYADGDEKWKDTLWYATSNTAEGIAKGGGLPWTGPAQLTERFRQEKKKQPKVTGW